MSIDAPEPEHVLSAADDEFHQPDSDDPSWAETCWFTFSVPERRLSGQLYPFFLPNLGVMSAGVYVWDDRGSQLWNCRYAKNFWHLPIPDQPLSDIETPNGIRYKVLQPLERYEVGFQDPDADDLRIDLTFTAVARPNVLMGQHLDQPGRFQGTIVLEGEEIAVDSYGFRDRSWGPRSQFGDAMHGASTGGYSYATASDRDGFHAITMDFDGACLGIHGYVLRDGVWSKLATATREVLQRDPDSGFPKRVALDLVDEAGRTLHAEGTCQNGIVFPLNPNLLTINCLTEWTFDGITAFGEDHDNWSAASLRRFSRRFQGWT
jgi:hypothetical protein